MADIEELADYQEEDEAYAENYDEKPDVDETNLLDESEKEMMKNRVAEMENELEKLTKMQMQVEQQITTVSDSIDENSIYVGQVDYEATPEELRAHFSPCGTINRITIMVDKATGQAKGFAYVEFVDKESVENALKLDDTPFKGRQLKVCHY
jgi:polyadenylate-binding protein 2